MLKRRTLLAAMAAIPSVSVLSACGGGGGGGGNADLRLLQASLEHDALDLYVEDTQELASVAAGTVSDYASVDSGSRSLGLRTAGGGTNLVSISRSLSGGKHYTLLAYDASGSVRAALLSEEEDNADAATDARLRVYNAALDAGTLAVYIGDVGASDGDLSVFEDSLAGGNISSFSDVKGASYRVVVTAADDKTDVRLNIASFAVPAGEVATLVLTTAAGGLLVDAHLLVQQGALTRYAGKKARVRLVAGVTDNATVAAKVGSTTLSTGVRAPSVGGSYVQVTAGTLALDITVNGDAVTADDLVAEAGQDYTLVVHGDSAAPQVLVLTDDNRAPATTTDYKIRLIHAVSGLDDTLSLDIDFQSAASGVAYGKTSAYASLAPLSTGSTLTVTSALQADALFSRSDLVLAAGGVYSLFMLGASASPSGILRRDR